MGLLNIFKKGDKAAEFPYAIKAAANGDIVAMKDIPDAVFAQGMLGPCIGIEPSDGTIAAPCDGKIVQLSDTLHAFGIQGRAEEQILVHIGIDTVSMNGDGFTAKAKAGDSVKAGQPIIEMDIDKVKAAGHPAVVITVLSNADDYSEVKFTDAGSVSVNDDILSISK